MKGSSIATSLHPTACRLAALWVLVGLSGCAVLPGMGGDDDEAVEEGVSEARVYEDFPPGAPQDCIRRDAIRSIDPVGNHTLLFYTRGGDVWRNRLQTRCLGARRNSVFSYEVRVGRLCANDIVRLLDDVGGTLQPSGACTLGQFDYLTEDQAEALKQYQ